MMRRATIFVAVLAVILFSGALSKPANADVSFSFFYSNLSPHGSWAVSANYGQVWRPYAYEPGWNPYYDGHWVYTDYGWTWVSDYAWGAIPYHYGTWALDPALGWIWVPGYVWAPSWVVFSSGPDYIGWAPVPPRYVVGASISFNSFAPSHCVVVPARSFLAPRVRGYAIPASSARVAISKTHIVNNIRVQNNVVVNRGPDPRNIEKAVGRSIRTEPIRNVQRIAPGGRFDPQEIRADRHSRGGAPRVTTPEPARNAGPARPAPLTRVQKGRQPESAQRHESAGAPRGSQPSRQPAHSRPPQATRETSQVGRPHESQHQQQVHGQPARGQQVYGQTARGQQGRGQQAQGAAKPPKPGKPEQKQPQGKHGGQ